MASIVAAASWRSKVKDSSAQTMVRIRPSSVSTVNGGGPLARRTASAWSFLRIPSLRALWWMALVETPCSAASALMGSPARYRRSRARQSFQLMSVGL
jgi:hypothetical protein